MSGVGSYYCSRMYMNRDYGNKVNNGNKLAIMYQTVLGALHVI